MTIRSTPPASAARSTRRVPSRAGTISSSGSFGWAGGNGEATWRTWSQPSTARSQPSSRSRSAAKNVRAARPGRPRGRSRRGPPARDRGRGPWCGPGGRDAAARSRTSCRGTPSHRLRGHVFSAIGGRLPAPLRSAPRGGYLHRVRRLVHFAAVVVFARPAPGRRRGRRPDDARPGPLRQPQGRQRLDRQPHRRHLRPAEIRPSAQPMWGNYLSDTAGIHNITNPEGFACITEDATHDFCPDGTSVGEPGTGDDIVARLGGGDDSFTATTSIGNVRSQRRRRRRPAARERRAGQEPRIRHAPDDRLFRGHPDRAAGRRHPDRQQGRRLPRPAAAATTS